MIENKKIIISKNDDFFDKDEIYASLFICPKCEYNKIFLEHKFCPNCGGKLKWLDIDNAK